jgi:putative ABC transport system substrate-binding protein
MNRRAFIMVLGGAALWPLVARAQRSERSAKIGFLYPGPVALARSRIEVILTGLRMAGYREGEQIQLVPRSADGDPTRLARLAAELIQEKVDVIVAVSTAAVRAVQAASATIPIVAHDLETDPVASGLIASYAQPGGRITGVFFDFPDFRTKWLELLREVIPGLASIALLWDPVSGLAQLQALQTAADQMRLKATVLKVSAAAEFDEAFAAASSERVDALLILSSPLFGARPSVLADLALRHKLPTVTLFPDFARAGGLIAYGPNLLDTYRPLGALVGKILQGIKPAELPVERPSKFELVVNVKTAKEIGVTIPTPILLRADEVIE